MNYKSFLLTAGLLVINSVGVAEIPDKFISALHQVESSGREGKIVGDGGKALGPLQIHRVYFLDAAQFDKSLGTNYNSVTNLAFSKRVVKAYLTRYARKAVATNNLEVLARIHNGGPTGHKKSATVAYWRRVEKNLR